MTPSSDNNHEPHFDAAEFIARALADERRFQSGAPLWNGAPTLAAAADHAAAVVKRLRRHPFCDEFHGALKLADRIADCGPGSKCGVCATCTRAIQCAVVTDGRALVAGTAPGLEICKMTVIFPYGRVPSAVLRRPRSRLWRRSFWRPSPPT